MDYGKVLESAVRVVRHDRELGEQVKVDFEASILSTMTKFEFSRDEAIQTLGMVDGCMTMFEALKRDPTPLTLSIPVELSKEPHSTLPRPSERCSRDCVNCREDHAVDVRKVLNIPEPPALDSPDLPAVEGLEG